jgi:pyridinium-3,5-biscarboxylic acid mononucleotide synthase
MNRTDLELLLQAFQRGERSLDETLARLEGFPLENLDFATLDHARAARHGFPEVVYGASKTPDQIAEIVARLLVRNGNVLVTRADTDAAARVAEIAPDAVYDEAARTIVVRRNADVPREGNILVVCAGTSDLPVAREAFNTCEILGNRVELVADVGVAGIHRLRAARVVICVAGMEAALPSVVGGLVSAPVIGVPTSVGYGAAFGGVTALLAMLNSCASNVTVVNIDNGFGAGYVASLINRVS